MTAPPLTPPGFPLLDLELAFEATRSIELPRLAGSTLRGRFGIELRRLACLTGAPTCKDCPLRHECAYTQVFEFPVPDTLGARQQFRDVPNPYVIVAHDLPRRLAAGSRFSFGFRLLGRAGRFASTAIEAWRQAMHRMVGARQGAAQLQQVFQIRAGHRYLIWQGREQTAAAEACAVACDVPNCKAVDIDFLSPLRLQDNGRILGPDELDEARLLNALVRRAYLLIACHADAGFKPEFAALKAGAERVVGERQLGWFQHSRQSNRNPARSPPGGAGKADIPMSGVIGRWRLSGEIAPFLPYLALGSWTGVGKMAVCGMGMYLLSVAV